MLEFISQSDTFELREFSKVVRRFAESQLGELTDFRRADFAAMGALGLTGMSLSEKVCGSASSQLEISAAIFEIARAQLGPAIYLSVHSMVSKLIEQFGAATNQQILEELAAAKKLGAFCLTEAHAGSDASALRTQAEDAGDSWILRGEKIYITSGTVADVYLVFARTGEHQTKGISAFVVERGTPGLTTGPAEKKMGCHGAPICSIHFDNCRIPKGALLGNVGDGYSIARFGLNGGRISIAACACGLASTALQLAAEHATHRKQFGAELATFQGLQFMLADMAMKLQASILLTRHAATLLDAGAEEKGPASMAKCFATDRAMEITTDGVQLLGGAGYLEDYKVERLMRDAKMLQIVEGTNQIQRSIISRWLFEQVKP